MDELEGQFWWYRALHRASSDWLKRLSLPNESTVLDAGCGTGGLLAKLAAQYPHLAFSGLEYDTHASRVAARKSGLAIQQGRIEAMPYPANHFDAIISNDVLCQQAVDQSVALQSCLTHLKPGGHLLLNLPAYEWLRSSHDRHVHVGRRYTAKALRQALLQAGFQVRLCSYRNGILLPIMALHRLTTGSNKETSDVEPVNRYLDNLLYTVTQIEQGLNNHGLYLPFGGSVTAWATKP
ncbi:MAG: class I SAM-dependent methyltransferase [Gammaproteobacteria bacterium]|nr:MAG: class I SAM-dependent methyltransferase [Gammaproteobacteria bacterium]